MNPPRPTKHRPLAIVCRLMLTLSLWHAPVPWGHWHAGSAAELAEHLALHHPHESIERLGWHWHLELPEWGHHQTQHSGGCPIPGETVTFDAAVVGAIVTCPMHTDWDCGQFLTTTFQEPIGLTERVETTAFLATFAPSHSPQQILCRLCC